MFIGKTILLENKSVNEISTKTYDKSKLFASLIFGCKMSNRTNILKKIYEKTQDKIE